MEACTATASASVPRAGLGTAVKPDWVRDAQLFPGTHLLFPGTRCHVAAFPGAGSFKQLFRNSSKKELSVVRLVDRKSVV